MRFSPRIAPLALLFLAACRTPGDGDAAKTAAAAAPAPAAASATAGGETAASAPADSAAIRAAADAGRILGSPNAKLWMLIASDFQCPYCKMWHDQTYEAIRREYVETGKLRVAFMNFPLNIHAQALPAAEAAMCASAQGKFWDYHTALFNAQERWAKAGDQTGVFDSLATAQGLDRPRFEACTRSHVMRALILADEDRMVSRGVASTPSFFIGNTIVAGAQPVGDFRRVIDAALAQSGPSGR